MIMKDPYSLKRGERIMGIGRFPVIWALWVVYLFPQLIGLGPRPLETCGVPPWARLSVGPTPEPDP